MADRQPDGALSLDRLEPIPKEVVIAKGWYQPKLTADEIADFLTIRRAIEGGTSVNRFYRASTKSDTLLRTKQTIHLHLGGKNSDTLLYLVQYPQHVLLVCIASHKHLDAQPPG